MKFKVILLSFLLVNFVFGLSFEERKSKLIRILQADVPHHSSYSVHHHRRHHHHCHACDDYSASAESRETKKRLRGAYGYGNPNPRYYNDYPGAYQPVIRVPYGYNYYTTPLPILGIFGRK